MQVKNRPEVPASLFARPLKRARYVAALLVVAVVVLCGKDAFHRRLSTASPPQEEEELPPEIEPRNDKGRGKKSDSGSKTTVSASHSPSLGGAAAAAAAAAEGAPLLDLDDDGGGEFEIGQEERGGGGGGTAVPPPPCYSSPEADPSEGVWRKAKGGVSESPATGGSWKFPTMQFDFLHGCKRTWRTRHPGDENETQPYWLWKPKNCALEEVTSAKFCQAMEGRKGVLLVGDSLTRLSTTTLASILRAEAITISQLQDDWSACGGKLRVRFMRNDFLDARTSPFGTVQCRIKSGEVADNTRCIVFADTATLEMFDTLVVNSGAHPRPGKEYGAAMRVAAKSLAASMKVLHGEDAVLVARNTVPGHWGCTERIFDEPANSSVATDLVNAAPPEYKWNTFGHSNALLEEAFSFKAGWRLLDAYSPTVLRADSHIGGKDCLHYCLPGPADHWIVLLYNILLRASAKSVQ